MYQSDDSDAWSVNPASSYSSAERSPSSISALSSPERAGFHRRMMAAISDKFRRITCTKRSEPQQSEELVGQGSMVDDSSYRSSSRLRPNQLASLLRNKLEKLRAARFFEVEQEAETAEEAIPMRSRSLPPEFLMFEEMEEKPPVSGVLPLLAGAAKQNQEKNTEKEYDEGSLAQLIHSKEPTIMLLNFPTLNKVIKPGNQGVLEGAGGEENADDSVWPFNTDIRGEIKVYDSGEVTVSFGDTVFRMALAAGPPNEQEVVCMHEDKTNKTSKMRSLGMVQHYVDILPLSEDGDESASVDKSMADTEETDASGNYFTYVGKESEGGGGACV